MQNKHQIRTLAMIAVMSAVTCVLGPMSIAIGPVPITFTNLAIYLSLYLLGWKGGTVSYLIYLLIGMVGMPVFSGYSGGLGKLVGATGGYLVGFIPMAIVAGLAIQYSSRRMVHLFAMAVGTTLCYGLGTLWFCYVMDTTAAAALAICVYPFVAGDLFKMGLAMYVGPLLTERLKKAGLAR